MNKKLKLVRFVVAATFGSLLWAGCESPRTYYVDATTETQPVDLTKRRADTRPESRSGLDHYAGRQQVLDVPASTVIEEPSGTLRVP